MKRRTVTLVYEEVLSEVYLRPRFIRSRYSAEFQMNWRNHLQPVFGEMSVTKVTPPHVFMWHREFTDSPYAGNRSKSVLSQIFSYAERKGYIPPNSNPCACVPSHPETQRDRFATHEELEKLGAILRALYDLYPREVTFIWLLILTGSRPSGLERSTWNNLTLLPDGTGFIRIDGKTGKEIVALPLDAVALISRLPRESAFVVGTFPRRFWEKIRKQAGFPDLWARDLRRTFASIALSNGVSLGSVGELLNHKKLQTTMRYAKLTSEARQSAVAQVGQHIGMIMG